MILAGRTARLPGTAGDRVAKLASRALELVKRAPPTQPIRVTVEPGAPAEPVRRLMDAFRPASTLHEDKAALDGVTLKIRSKYIEFEMRLGADAESVTKASAALALEELNHRRQAAATHYRALAADGKQEELRTYLQHYQELSRVYSQLYQLQRRAKR